MKTEHLNNLSFEIPDDWIIEKNENNFLIHKNKGRGVLTLSFDNINNLNHNIGNHISDMLSKYAEKNKIKVVWELGIPGKISPITCAEKIKKIIYEKNVT